MIETGTTAEVLRMVATTAPELVSDGRPFYIVDSVDVDGVIVPADAVAYTPLTVEYAIRDHLVERGAWRGPGTTIVLDVAAIRREKCRGHCRQALLQIVLHETAHNLPVAQLAADIEPTPQLRDWQLRAAERWASKPAPLELDPWHNDHDEKFVRRSLHLHYRANAAGFDIPLHGLCAGSEYELSPPALYRHTLGDEPHRMAGASFAEIMATPAPEQFMSLWKSNVKFWEDMKGQVA